MIIVNNHDYFKSGQTYKDVIFAIIEVLGFFLLFGIPFIYFSNSILLVVWILINAIWAFDEYKQYSHAKKIIVSRDGIRVIEKIGDNIRSDFYDWEKISSVEYCYSRNIRGGGYFLTVYIESFSTSWNGTKKENFSIVFSLSEFQPFLDRDSFVKLVRLIYCQFFRNIFPKKHQYKNTSISDIDIILSNICKEKNKIYKSKRIL